jgi:diguanylate cyclase (GGDEF)-like protein/putative nucleotidyltransferase with HDIG domain
MIKKSPWTNAYIGTVIACGLIAAAMGAVLFRCHDPVKFACFLAITFIASTLKVRLPGITGTMSVSYVFVLISIVEMSFGETVLISCAALVAQTVWRTKEKPQLVQVAFNVASIAVATSAAYTVYYATAFGSSAGAVAVRLVTAGSVYFVLNTLSIAIVIALTEGKSARRIWQDCYFWSFPYYLLGASLAGLLSLSNHLIGWQISLLVTPVLYLIYRSYRLYLDRLESEKNHAEQISNLHLRTIEALALAIEAKDDNTHQHLERVQVYAVEIARELGLPEEELEALRAAAILHDIGKLAVPEHIISKPGKLTPEEFGKMKIHPVVGAEIVERVRFPYPVSPIVRSHHERWDGTGYPDGLAGEEIPRGARILAAVDCLDALASDRQYRRALPLDEAMRTVASLSGTSYDPRVVAVLQARYRELEQKARSEQTESQRPRERKIERGHAPGAGLERTAAALSSRPEFLMSIAAAREEVQTLYELSQDLGSSLSLHETLSVLDVRLRRMIPYDGIAVWVQRGDVLKPEYVQGENHRLFSSLEIPLGEGLSGWVAENGKPIINGNPSVEPGYLDDPAKFSTLRSALSVRLETASGVLGVLTLYHADRDAFTPDHLRVLLAIVSKASLALENALKFRQAEISATTDGLTGLPNARSLFLHLDAELERARRSGTPVAVLVCDLDGFKQVNDRFGHLEGNEVLKRVGQQMKERCREYDYVARMGGDEFVLVLPGLTRAGVRRKTAVIAQVARNAGLEVCGEPLLSMSVGEAYYPDHGTTAEQLLAEADRQMYHAKKQHKMETELVPAMTTELEMLSVAVQ